MENFIITTETKLKDILKFLYKETKKMASTMKKDKDKRFWKKIGNTCKRMAIKIEANYEQK